MVVWEIYSAIPSSSLRRDRKFAEDKFSRGCSNYTGVPSGAQLCKNITYDTVWPIFFVDLHIFSIPTYHFFT